ncbi:MAG: hypothetical protein DMG55_16945 [Acidobacteria bacterium]|nr:MAG: hypothetical protein DMG55_16945 [Acidobacteriota bacterium]
MKVLSLRLLLPIAALLVAFGPNPARAQAPLEPAQMSPRTAFYLIWHGVPSPDVRKANSLLALWDDPDFAPVSSAMVSNLMGSSAEKTPKEKLIADEIQQYATLLENSFTIGYVSEPQRRAASKAGGSLNSKPAWNGMFLVYDRTGKEVLLSKAVLRLRTEEKEAPRLSQVTIGGAQVLKAEGKSGISYWAEHGKYAVSTGERSVMEEILGRLDGKLRGAASLTQSAAYQEAQANLGSGLIEFFLRIPDLENLAADSKAGTFQVGPLLDAAGVAALHSVSGHVSFEGAKTHVQAALLGDAATGTPFDVWATGQSSLASLSFVPVDAVSYTSAQLNFLGIYDTVKRVARAAFPQAQQGNADLLDTIAQHKLGMPAAEALGLLTGEFASMQTSASMDSTKQVYFLGIRKRPETLKLMRTVFSDQITSERNEDDITFLKISLGGKQGSTQWNSFNLAVAPDMILGANRVETLREVLAHRAHASAVEGLATAPQFQAGRAKFPEHLNGLSYFDFQKVDWQALKDRWIEEAKKSPVARTMNSSQNVVPSSAPDWLAQCNPQVFSRHLHYSVSVSWKDSKGIHWDQWVE